VTASEDLSILFSSLIRIFGLLGSSLNEIGKSRRDKMFIDTPPTFEFQAHLWAAELVSLLRSFELIFALFYKHFAATRLPKHSAKI
jgi:hypothetical protein